MKVVRFRNNSQAFASRSCRKTSARDVMTVRFIRIWHDHPPGRLFSADVEINGQLHHFETRANDVIEALETFCARLRRDFGSELDTYEPRQVSAATLIRCHQCDDCGWVCEAHPELPWQGDNACTCGAAGLPCPRCNSAREWRDAAASRWLQDGRRQGRLAALTGYFARDFFKAAPSPISGRAGRR